MIEQFLKYSTLFSILIAITSILISIYLYVKNRQQSKKYLSIVKNLTSLNKDIFEDIDRNIGLNYTQKLEHLILIADKFKYIFDIVTKTEISVSIYVFIKKGELANFKLITCDNKTNRAKNNSNYNKETSILADLPASMVFLGNIFFIENNVSKAGNYYSHKFDFKNSENITNANLPYYSILVVPIKDIKNNLLLGYLSFESDKKNAFDINIDIRIAQELSKHLEKPLINIISELNITNYPIKN